MISIDERTSVSVTSGLIPEGANAYVVLVVTDRAYMVGVIIETGSGRKTEARTDDVVIF